MEPDRIVITGARQHNLKHITVDDPEEGARGADRRLGLGQVLARVRHALRRGPAPLHREPLRLRAPVPRADGEAALRLDQGPGADDLDRAEDGEHQPALDRRHGHRDPRLPARAVGARRPAHLPPLRPAGLAAVGPADRARGDAARRGHEVPGAGAARARAQGRAPGRDRAGAQGGLHARQARRDRALARGRPGPARQEEEAHDRGGRRPAGREARPRASGSPTRSRPRCGSAKARWSSRRRARRTRCSPSTGRATTAGSRSRSCSRSCSRSTRRRACAPSAPGSARAWRWTRRSWCRTPSCRSTRAPSSRSARSARRPPGAATSCARSRASARST